MIRQALLTILILAAAAFCGVAYFSGAPANAVKAEIPSARIGDAQPQKVIAIAAAVQQRDHRVISPMFEQFERAPNFAAFIHDSMQRPQEGGRFYAKLAYLKCQQVAALKLVPPAPSAQAERAAKEVQALQQRCAGVAAQFPSELTFMAAIKHANERGPADALILPGGLFGARSRAEAMQHVQYARSSGSAYLLAATLEINVEHFAESLSPVFANGANRELLFRASAAASCEVAGRCHDDLRVLATCAIEGDCEDTDLRAYLRSNLDPASQQLFDETRQKIVNLGKE